MNSPRSRWLAFGLLSSAGAGVLGLTSVTTAATAFGAPCADEGDCVALITAGADNLGGTTSTGPTPDFVTDVYNLYINPTGRGAVRRTRCVSRLREDPS